MSSASAAKLAFVTGGSRGLGYEVARGLARTGISSVLIAKDAERLENAATQLRAEFPGITFETSTCDLEDQVQTRKTAEDLLNKFGAPFALVLAHGVMSEKMSKTLRTTDAEWRRVMAINLDSVFTLVNVLGAPMAEARDGRRVVIFSACLGRMSGPGNAGGLAPYRISKAGVNAFVRNLAHETGLGARGFYVDLDRLHQHRNHVHRVLFRVHVVSMLMQSVQIIPAPTWAAQTHLGAPKKAQSARCG